MIVDFILFSRQASFSIQEKGDGSGVISGYTVADVDSLRVNFRYTPAIFRTNNRFCIALNADILVKRSDQDMQEIVELLGPMFFSPAYFTLDGHPSLFIISSSGKKDEEQRQEQAAIKAGLQVFFTHLGYDRFYFALIDEKNYRVTDTNIGYRTGIYNKTLGDDIQDLGNWYSGLLEQGAAPGKLLFTLANPHVQTNPVSSMLNQTETEARKKNPTLFSLLEENSGLLKLQEGNSTNMHLLELDLESKRAYIANASAQGSLVKKIADFYKNEYEVLPMWYKRFGHIMKVLMGKRSFRSLFDDKVKKYKD